MPWQLWIIGGFGIGGIACAISFWIWLRSLSRTAAQAESLRQQNKTNIEVLHDIEKAKEIRERLVSDAGFSHRVRAKFQRD